MEVNPGTIVSKHMDAQGNTVAVTDLGATIIFTPEEWDVLRTDPLLLTPAAQAVLANVLTPSAGGGGSVTLSPAALGVVAALLAPTVAGSGAAILTPAAATASLAAPAPTVATSGAAVITPAPVVASIGIRQPSVGQSAAVAHALKVSPNVDRSGAVPLDGATIQGSVAIFTAHQDEPVQVKFYLDDPDRTGAALHTENVSPWDMGGTDQQGDAVLIDVSAWGTGPHTVTAWIDEGGGVQTTIHADVQVEGLTTATPLPVKVAASLPAPFVSNPGGGSQTVTPSARSVSFSVRTPANVFTADPQPDGTLTGTYTTKQSVPAGQVWEVSGQATFDNVSLVVNGTLRMRPGATIQFINTVHSNYQGGDPVNVDTDPGLFVMGSGKLDLKGTPKMAWNRTGDDASWLAADTLIRSPITTGEDWYQFQSFTKGGVVPASPEGYKAEVMNLTRDVKIMGEDGHHAHILVMSDQPQTIEYVEIAYMGVPRLNGVEDVGVTGRYGLHFHMTGNGSQGSIVKGVVIREGGNHSFVPHSSHGITFEDCVVYHCKGYAYWWDPGDQTNDVLFDRCVAAYMHQEPSYRGGFSSGWLLGRGTNMTVKRSVAVGCQGVAGYNWPEQANQSPNVWIFTDNLAHHMKQDGIEVWQNDTNDHFVDDFRAFQCNQQGIDHGAYGNNYRYRRAVLDRCDQGLKLHATASEAGTPTRADGYQQAHEDYVVRGGRHAVTVTNTAGQDQDRVLIINGQFSGQSEKKVHVSIGGGEARPVHVDFVNCGLTLPDDVSVNTWAPNSEIRFQEGSSAWRLNSDGTVTSIGTFYPDPDGPTAP